MNRKLKDWVTVTKKAPKVSNKGVCLYLEDSNQEFILTPRGHYQLNVMPFGLNIAPQVFQSSINKRKNKLLFIFLTRKIFSSIYEFYYLGKEKKKFPEI